ncbi:unnamed protein product [Leptidea sinapis]|uniref:Uncharacterized protein n=1 Tax=Leptidea sinapis TaxID=189913 RepID=A0A5E4QGQ4_9NEOP|nr:unnamed protein product [Leptidea sinapis]
MYCSYRCSMFIERYISKSFIIFFLVVLTLCGNSNGYNVHLPNNWPSPWSDGIIPFTFNYFSLTHTHNAEVYDASRSSTCNPARDGLEPFKTFKI